MTATDENVGGEAPARIEGIGAAARRHLWIGLALVAMAATAVALIVMIAPDASAAGGCGGG
jgi:hypothetical protein